MMRKDIQKDGVWQVPVTIMIIIGSLCWIPILDDPAHKTFITVSTTINLLSSSMCTFTTSYALLSHPLQLDNVLSYSQYISQNQIVLMPPTLLLHIALTL